MIASYMILSGSCMTRFLVSLMYNAFLSAVTVVLAL